MRRPRLLLVAALLAALALAVAGRAFQVMVLEHDSYQRLARRQQQRVLDVPSPRGDIVSADGYLLATSAERVAIQVDTHLLRYPELLARAAAPVLGADEKQLAARLTSGPRAVWLAQQVEPERAREVHALAPGAVALVPDAQRLYPQGTTAAALVGFVGREELQTVGRAGLEHHYDHVLAGEPMRYLAIHDAVQRQLRLEPVAGGRAGFALELTVLARLQATCERELQHTLAEVGGVSASAVVLDPATGDVLAAASMPGFDPSDPGSVPPARWRLRAFQDGWEPGSTIKPLVAATALAAGVVHPGERFECRHRGITVAGHWIGDHVEPGTYTLEQVIARSSNAGAVEIAQRVPPRLLYRGLAAFGLGRAPDVGFPAETAGLLAPVTQWSAMSPAGLALGQEMTVSPLQLAAAYAAIANGGWLPRPRVVARVFTSDGASSGESEWRARVMDADLAARITAMLELVVEDGTGERAQVPGFRVAGKTGTAQRAVDGGFDASHHVAWFAGFFPLPHPRAVIVVAVEEPQRDYWAASVAAPCFARIARDTATLMGIPPHEPGADEPRPVRLAVRATSGEGGVL